jgi:hypothetical protein
MKLRNILESYVDLPDEDEFGEPPAHPYLLEWLNRWHVVMEETPQGLIYMSDSWGERFPHAGPDVANVVKSHEAYRSGHNIGGSMRILCVGDHLLVQTEPGVWVLE